MYFPKLLSLALTLPLAIALPTFLVNRGVILGSSRALAQSFPDISSPTAQLYLQAEGLVSLGFTEEGIALYGQLLQQIRDRDGRLEEARFLQGIASNFESRGDFQHALTYYQQALEIYGGGIISPIERTSQLTDASEVVNAIASIYMKLGQTEQALATYQQALEIDRRAENPLTEVETLSNLATTYRLTGQTEQALSTYQQAIAVYTDPYSSPKILNQIGIIYQEREQFEQALAAYQQAIPLIAEQSEELPTIDRVLTLENISNLYRVQGQTAQAANYAQQAEAALTQASTDEFMGENLSRKADLLKQVGAFYLSNGLLERAKSYFDRAVATDSQSPGSRLEYLLPDIVVTYSQHGQTALAIPYQERYAELLQDQTFSLARATSLSDLAAMYQKVEQLDRALTTYQQALTAFQEFDREFGWQSDEIAKTLLAIGTVHESREQFEFALTAYQQALSLSGNGELSVGKIQILERLAQFYETQGQRDRAQDYTQQAQTLRNQLLEHLSQRFEQVNQMYETQGQRDRTP